MTTTPVFRLPSVDRLLGEDPARALVARFGHSATVEALRAELAHLRAAVQAGNLIAEPHSGAILAEASAKLEAKDAPSQRRVFNLTGTVLHTNLGRAILPEAAIEAVVNAMRHPTTL